MSEPTVNSHPDDITLDAYIDQELTAAETTQVDAHLVGCPRCRQYLQARRSFFALIAESEDLALSRDMSTGVLETLQQKRLRLLTGLLALETVLAAVLLALFGSRMIGGVLSHPLLGAFANTLLWLGERVIWLGTQVEAGLMEISNAIALVPKPGFAGLPVLQLTVLHWTGILTGIFLLWLLVNRVLIDGAGMQRSKVS